MKRLHVHLSVADLESSVGFYSAVFGCEPAVRKADYAKWMLEDPRLNFAISTRSREVGLDHLGIQAENEAELIELKERFDRAGTAIVEQKNAGCCYAVSDKYWALDPQRIPWESFHSLGEIPVFGEEPDLHFKADRFEDSACCAPELGPKSSKCCG
jgi:catechol 2,3-dioxygenase-like lactoylglutathione lyase family enzyme